MVNKRAVRILLECNLAILKSNVDLIFEEFLRLCHLTCNMMTLKIIKPWVYVVAFCCFFAAAMEFSYHFNYVVQASIYQDFFFKNIKMIFQIPIVNLR